MYTAVTGNLVDSTGAAITNATAYFRPCNNVGAPLSYQVQGSAQASDAAVPAAVVAGAFTVQLADTTLTQPINICFQMTVVDNLTGKQLLGPGYLIQPSGAAWNFNQFIPNVPALTTIQPGIQGPSNYQLWIEAGNSGSVTDYLNSIKGPIAPCNFLAGSTAPYTIPAMTPGQGNLFVTIPAADSLDTHVIGLPHPCDLGTIVYVQNTGTGVPFVAIGSGMFARPRPGDVVAMVCTDNADSNWEIISQFALPLGTLQTGATGTYLDGQDFLYWNGNAGATITIASQSIQGHKMSIANYGGNAVTVTNGGNIRNVTGDLVIPPGGSVLIENISTDFLWVTATNPVTISQIPATSVTGTLNASQIPGLDASKITSGVIDAARLPSGSGGSGVSPSIPNLFTAPQSFAMGPTTTPGITLYGDSITNGAGATIPANAYANLVKQQFNGIYLNLSQGGDEAADLTLKAHTDSIPTTFNPTRTVFIGHNDVAFKGATAAALNVFTTCLTAALSYLAIPNYYKAFGQAGVLSGFAADHSYDPGGGEDPQFKAGMAVTATAQGSTCSVQVTTTQAEQAVYIGYLGMDGNGGTASVSIDGVVVDSITAAGPGLISTTNGRTKTVWGKRYLVSGAGVHTILITVTSATAAGNSFTFLWAGTPAPALSLPGMPRVFVLDPLYQAAFNQQAVTDAYIAALAPLVAQLAADGLYVARLITNDYVDNATDMAGTVTTAPDGTVCPASTTFGLHPNDCGMQHIANMITGAAMPTVAATPASITLGVQQQAAGVTGNLNSPLAYIAGPGTFTLPVGVMGSLIWVMNTGTGPLTVATKNGTTSVAASGGQSSSTRVMAGSRSSAK